MCLRPLGSARSLAQVRESLGELAAFCPPSAKDRKDADTPANTTAHWLEVSCRLAAATGVVGCGGLLEHLQRAPKQVAVRPATRGSPPCPQLDNGTAASLEQLAPPKNRNPWLASPKGGAPRGLCKGAAERTQSGHVERGRPKPLADGPQFPLTSELPRCVVQAGSRSMASSNWRFRQVFGEKDSTEDPADGSLSPRTLAAHRPSSHAR